MITTLLDFLSTNHNITLLTSIFSLVTISLLTANMNFKIIKSFCISSTNSLASLVLHLSGVIWASSVSIYNVQLRDQIVNHTAPIDLIGGVFLLANAIAVLLLTSRYRGDKLKEELERSLPPTRVLEEGANLHSNNLKIHEQISGLVVELKFKALLLPQNDLDTHKKHGIKITDGYINTVISSISTIANNWTKERHGNINYSINIFSVIDVSDYEPDQELDEALLDSPFFLFTDSLESRIKFCDKLLISQQQYSTCSKDSQGKPLVLPFSHVGKKEKHHPNFEGAPTSIEKNEARYIPDTKEVANSFFKRIESTHHGDYVTTKYKEDIRLYYKNDNTRSLLSIPLFDKDNEIIAVLNVYSRTKNMLSSEKRAESFYHFIRPQLNILTYLIASQITIVEM